MNPCTTSRYAAPESAVYSSAHAIVLPVLATEAEIMLDFVGAKEAFSREQLRELSERSNWPALHHLMTHHRL